MTSSLIATVNRQDAPPASSTLSHLSIVPIPRINPTVHLLSVAGQLGTPPPNTPPTPMALDFRTQATHCLANVTACLSIGGATPRDITKINIYVVGLNPSMRADLIEVLTEFFTFNGEQHKPPSTLLGVAGLAGKDYLIEIDATAVVAVY